MKLFTRAILVFAMIILGIVSMWTTYQSLHDSILPTPVIQIRFSENTIWDCSVFALALSVAIGLMLYALKLAIIDEQKRLNVLGVIGLTVVGFISISFNMDVLYRWAHQSFFINYSASRVKSAYEDYLTQTQQALITKRDELLKQVAKQEGELDAEIKGLREAPAGYGSIAKSEDYHLTLLQKTTGVELKTIEEAIAKKQEADKLLADSMPANIEEVEKLQHELRVLVKDVGSVSGESLPEPVRLESPLFAVFRKLFDWQQVGLEEIFFVLLAFFLDLGDIIGYSLVPAARKKTSLAPAAALADAGFTASELPSLPPTPGYAPITNEPRPPDQEAQHKPHPDQSPGIEEQHNLQQKAAGESRRARRPITFRRK